MLLQERDSDEHIGSAIRRRNEKALASLAHFKVLNAANDALSGQKPPAYDEIMKNTQLTYSQIYYNEQMDTDAQSSTRTRTEGKFYPGDGTEHYIWIEWKTYKVKHDRRLDKQVPLKENVKRIRELVALLKADKAKEFSAPQCLGYFDDRDEGDQNEHDFRFGLVLEKPSANCAPVSLRQLMISKGFKRPSFTDRALLAHKIATCVLYLHAVNWLHKALRSDSMLFFFPEKEKQTIARPYLSCYEYARPNRDGETTTGGDINEWWELYVHPNYQGHAAKGTYRKTFDIYSLGIILLEIPYWQPMETIVGIDPDQATADELKGIRSRLLKQLEPERELLDRVESDHGCKYYAAATACIEGCTAFGIQQEENENSSETGVKLQREFTKLVVDSLEGISV